MLSANRIPDLHAEIGGNHFNRDTLHRVRGLVSRQELSLHDVTGGTTKRFGEWPLDTSTPEGVRQRLMRLQNNGASTQYLKLRDYISVTQARLTSTFVEKCSYVRTSRALLKPNLDLHVAAVVI